MFNKYLPHCWKCIFYNRGTVSILTRPQLMVLVNDAAVPLKFSPRPNAEQDVIIKVSSGQTNLIQSGSRQFYYPNKFSDAHKNIICMSVICTCM